jgi:hypothetical protein
LLAACGTDSGGGEPTNVAGAGSGGSSGDGNAVGGAATLGGSSAAGAAVSAGSGGKAAPAGTHCEGGMVVQSPFFSGVSSDCFGDRLAFDLPNPTDVTIDDIVLPAPLTPGAPSAVSLEIEGGGKLNVELWGTDAACGKAKELLWVGPLAAKISCAAFTPSLPHSHLLFVLRPIDGGEFISNLKAVGLCGGGSCPMPDGMGRTADAPLSSAQQSYELGAGWTAKGFDGKVGGYGRIWVTGAARPAEGGTMAITGGVFRAPTPFEPYGDAYYCLGEGSTVTDLGKAGMDLSLANVTRLGACDELKGSGTLDMTVASNAGEVTSSLAPLTIMDDAASGSCFGTHCSWELSISPKFVWVDFITANDMGTSLKPTLMESPIKEAAILLQETDGSPYQLACGATGSALYDPKSSTTLSVTDLGELHTCPGTPIEGSSAQLHLYK